ECCGVVIGQRLEGRPFVFWNARSLQLHGLVMKEVDTPLVSSLGSGRQATENRGQGKSFQPQEPGSLSRQKDSRLTEGLRTNGHGDLGMLTPGHHFPGRDGAAGLTV